MGGAVSQETGSTDDDQTAEDPSQATSSGFKKRRRQRSDSLAAVLALSGQSGESSMTANDAPPVTLPATPSPSTMRKKHRMEKERICKVCGDKAVAHNFDAITCESCKTFFRRNAHKKLKACQFQDNCEITVLTRRHCPSCRLQKCFQIGMKAEFILDEAERKARMEKINNNRKKRMQAAQKHDQNKTNDSDMSPCLICTPDSSAIDLLLQESDCDLAADAFFTDLSKPGTSQSTQEGGQEEESAHSSISSKRESQDCCDSQQQGHLQGCSDHQNTESEDICKNLSQTQRQVDPSDQQQKGADDSVNHLKTTDHACNPQESGVNHTNNRDQVDSDFQSSQNVDDLDRLPSAGTSGRCQNCSQRSSLSSNVSVESEAGSVFQNEGGDGRQKELQFVGVPDCLFPSDPSMYWTLTPEEQSEIVGLTTLFQEEFPKVRRVEVPEEELVVQLEGLTLEKTFSHLETFGLELIHFLKRVADFSSLHLNDQQALLKASTMLIVMVTTSSSYSIEKEAFIKGLNAVPSKLYREVFQNKDIGDRMVEFSHAMKSILKEDRSVFPLLICYILFDPLVPSVSDRQRVNFFRDKYTLLLKHYLESMYSYMFAGQYQEAVNSLLQQGKLIAADTVADMSIWKNMMSPLLKELWDLS